MRLNRHRELYWLARHYKGTPLPEVVYDPAMRHCGEYSFPCNGEILIDGQHIDTGRGIVLLGTAPTGATIAHEWRHHLQTLALGDWDAGYAVKLDLETYWSHPMEADALRYELALSPDDISQWYADQIGARTAGRIEALDHWLAPVEQVTTCPVRIDET